MSPELDPDGREECAVYADKLLEEGDPLGEIMAMSLGTSRFRDFNLRELVINYLDATYPTLGGRFLGDRSVWKYGLIRKLTLRTPLCLDAARALATTSAMQFMRELDLHIQPERDGSPRIRFQPSSNTHYRARFIRLGLHFFVMQEDGSVLPTNLNRLYPQLASLEELSLTRPENGGYGLIDLPALRMLTVTPNSSEAVRELNRAKLPELSRLQISSTPWSFLAGLELDAPNLERLMLWGTGDESPGASFDAIARAPLVRQLAALEFNYVNGEGAGSLLRIAPSLVHLDQVRVDQRALDASTRAELMRILGPRLVLQ